MMLLTSTLPLLPPPSSSLLPPLTTPSSDHYPSSQPNSHNHPQPSRRQKHNQHHSFRNNTLLALSTDERTISQRKMAIAMYGYSWLKPAGCAKTMLGRREEEVERDEVEKQLREVELQERMTVEAEEQERVARTRELGEPEEGRDLDEDIPDADDEGEEEEFESEEGDVVEGEEGEDEGLAVDLDDEIPDADELDTDDEDEPLSPTGADGGWVYDTRREPDTDDEDQLPQLLPPQFRARGHGRHATVAGVRVPVPGSNSDYDERGAEDLANSMLDEDEMFDHETRGSARDLDDDVPDADDDQAWEHTDTELEESEMDISILPGQPQHGRSSGLGITQTQQPRRSSARTIGTAPRSSGPWITDPSPIPSPPNPQTNQAQIAPPQTQTLPRHRGVQTATPSLASSSNIRSTSTRAARIVSGNRQRPYRPDRIHLPPPPRPHQLQQAQTPDMVDTPPLAAATADLNVGLDVDVGEEGEDLEEADTDVEEDINVETPDPFAAPEFARAHGIARQDRDAVRTGRAQHGVVRAAGNDIGAPRDIIGDANDMGRGNPSPTRTAAARNWLDGAAAAIGVGGTREANRNEAGNGTGSGPRRTLFQRATRRRNLNPDAEIFNHAAQIQTQTSAASGSGTGTSSGGLFSSPPPPLNPNSGTGLAMIENEALGEWDTPEGPGAGPSQSQSQEQTGRGGRRRSGRFLGRRRGVE